jgi:vitamin B12 transporter
MERRATIQGKATWSDFPNAIAHSLNPRFITLETDNIKVLKMNNHQNQSAQSIFRMLLAATIATTTYSTAALAQQIQDDEAISEIVVTAKGQQELIDVLPTSHILTAADIEASQAQDIPDLLDQISGLSVRDSGGRGSATGFFLRGTSSSQTIVLIDGVRVGSATLGSATLNAYPIEAIERIEVVKGPLSGIYGADAVGGVIQLFTKKGGEGLGEITATIGSDSLTEYGLAFNGGNDKHSFRISAHAEDTDGIDRTSILTGGNDD